MTENPFENVLNDPKRTAPSEEWPPILIDGEEIAHRGAFSRNAWFRKNVMVVVVLVLGFIAVSPYLSEPVPPKGIFYIIGIIFFGTAITYLIYRKQEWIVTDRAVYFKNARPLLLANVKKVGGFGATIRYVGKFGLATTTLGVEDAANLRRILTGRAPK